MRRDAGTEAQPVGEMCRTMRYRVWLTSKFIQMENKKQRCHPKRGCRKKESTVSASRLTFSDVFVFSVHKSIVHHSLMRLPHTPA